MVFAAFWTLNLWFADHSGAKVCLQMVAISMFKLKSLRICATSELTCLICMYGMHNML